MLEVLTGFAEELRAAGLPVTTSEVLDAAQAIELTGMPTKEQLRSVLAATLVKRADHMPVFDLLFEVYFSGRSHPSEFQEDAPQSKAHELDMDMERILHDALSRARGAQGGLASRSGASSQLDPEEIALSLLRALLTGDSSGLERASAEAVRRFGGFEPGRQVAGRYYVYRTLRQLDLEAIRAALADLVAREDPGLSGRLLKDEVESRVEALREAIEREVRRILVQDRGARTLARSMRATLPEDVDLLHASQQETAAMKRALVPIGRKLAARLARKRHSSHRGPVDLRRTVRSSLSTGGAPLELHFKPPRPAKPELFVLADISGSVAAFARFTLQLVYSIGTQFSRVRSFVFVDGVDEVTDLLNASADPGEALGQVALVADVVWMDGHSDYGHVLEVFGQRWGDQLTKRTSLLVLGDARGNYHDPRASVLRELRSSVKHLYWLNPEPKAYWGTGDSAMDAYAPYCDAVVECRTLRQLESFVGELG
jgi:uncharacterized protein with von Willebrand factor type A (vWA) domain